MLTQAHIDIIKATAPLVGQHAREITDHFYPLMFQRYPAVKEIFNQSHQQKGSQPQALANALVAYATHIDQLGELSDAVKLIVHKHCSLNVLPEHYPIVGECLIESVGAVLGEAVTAEIAAAWQAAYQQLADLLINAEENLYQSNSERRGGWRGERAFRIDRIVKESDVISSFYLRPCEGEHLIDFTPGQYVGLIVELNGQRVRRNYSLSDAPGKEGVRISVKRENDGLISGYLHNCAATGDIVMLTAPAGSFVLDAAAAETQRPLVFVTGGVGITPAFSMLNSCVASGRPIIFVHAAINGRHHAFADDLSALAREYANLRTFIIYEKPQLEDKPDAVGLVNQKTFEALLPPDRDVDLYFLGPKPFMANINAFAESLGIPSSQRHYEFFGPAEQLSVLGSDNTH